MKTHEITDLKASWGTDEEVLEVLRKLIQMASHLSFAVRAPSFTDLELRQLDLLARDAVRSGPLCPFCYFTRVRVVHFKKQTSFANQHNVRLTPTTSTWDITTYGCGREQRRWSGCVQKY